MRVGYLDSFRTAGGAVLVGAADDLLDEPADWATLSTRQPTEREAADLDLAWRLVRGVVSNAIVLVRDGQLVGLGSGQVSRVDACRQAVAKAERFHAPDGARARAKAAIGLIDSGSAKAVASTARAAAALPPTAIPPNALAPDAPAPSQAPGPQ